MVYIDLELQFSRLVRLVSQRVLDIISLFYKYFFCSPIYVNFKTIKHLILTFIFKKEFPKLSTIFCVRAFNFWITVSMFVVVSGFRDPGPFMIFLYIFCTVQMGLFQ